MVSCNFITADNRQEHGRIAFAAALLRVLRIPCTEEDFCASIASMIYVVHPPLREALQAAFQERNVQLHEVKVPSQAVDNNVDMTPYDAMPVTWSVMLVYFGCCILPIFECFHSDTHYEIFMKTTIRAMRAKVGLQPADDNISIPFSRKHASSIRAVLGGSKILKEAILKYLNDEAINNGNSLGSLCHYLITDVPLSGLCLGSEFPMDHSPTRPFTSAVGRHSFWGLDDAHLAAASDHNEASMPQSLRQFSDRWTVVITSLKDELDGERRLRLEKESALEQERVMREEAINRANAAEEALVVTSNELSFARALLRPLFPAGI